MIGNLNTSEFLSYITFVYLSGIAYLIGKGSIRRTVFLLSTAIALTITGCSSANDVRTPQQSGYSVTGGAGGQRNDVLQNAAQGNGYSANSVGWQSNGMTVGVRQQAYESTGSMRPGSVQAGSGQTEGSRVGATANHWPSAISDSDTGIQVLNVKTPVKQGSKGSLTVKGVPSTVYTVTAVYTNARGRMTAASSQISGADGRVTWVWNVKPDTLPGTYQLVVSGGGKMIDAAYTVTK